MRLKVGRLGRPVEWDLPIEFGREQLTSYGGLELRHFPAHRSPSSVCAEASMSTSSGATTAVPTWCCW
jgi:hypothetical protein